MKHAQTVPPSSVTAMANLADPSRFFIVRRVIMPDDVYFALFNDKGDKAAPWADADTPEKVIENMLRGAPL